MFQFGIVNSMDRPCLRLIVIKLGDKCYYICDRVTQRGGMSCDEFVPLDDFGVEVNFFQNTVACKQVCDSRARYPDGRPRDWQGYDDAVETLRSDLCLTLGS